MAARKIGPVTDHKGQIFPNQLAMCNHYNIKANTFRWRIKQGYTVKDALTAPRSKKFLTSSTPAKFEDHLGNKFTTFQEMCEAWDVTRSMAANRLKRGHSLESALTTPPMVSGRPRRDFSKEATRRQHIRRVVNLKAPDIQLIMKAWV